MMWTASPRRHLACIMQRNEFFAADVVAFVIVFEFSGLWTSSIKRGRKVYH